MTDYTPTIQEWQEAVKDSFLSEEQKSQLLAKLETSGPADEFTDLFDTMLAEGIDATAGTYEKILSDFDTMTGAVDREYEEKKKILDDQLEKDLTQTEEDGKRDSILDSYYKKLDELMTWHEAQLKTVIGQTTLVA